MVITKFEAGLGNQMFQYASGKALAKRLSKEHVCDISSYRTDGSRNFSLNDFNITSRLSYKDHETCVKSKRSLRFWKNALLGKECVILKDPIWELNPDFFELSGDIILMHGYWAWKEYFAGIKEDLKKEFSLKEHLQDELTKWKAELVQENSVAVHIRRGDYLNNFEVKNFGVQQLSYYIDSMRWISERWPRPTFYLFSDDIDWVIKTWLADFRRFGICIPVFPNVKGSAALELRKMSSCQSQIIANSSFSWWAAWLNDHHEKVVLQPRSWYKNEEWQSAYEKGKLNTDKGWIKI